MGGGESIYDIKACDKNCVKVCVFIHTDFYMERLQTISGRIGKKIATVITAGEENGGIGREKQMRAFLFSVYIKRENNFLF